MKIKFTRPRQLVDSARSYRIFIDGKQAEIIRFGTEKELEIDDCSHEIFLKIDWCTSNTLIINEEKKERILLCYNTFYGWKMFTLFIPLYYITFGRKRYLTLRENL